MSLAGQCSLIWYLPETNRFAKKVVLHLNASDVTKGNMIGVQ